LFFTFCDADPGSATVSGTTTLYRELETFLQEMFVNWLLWNKYIIRLSHQKKIRKNKLQEKVNHASKSKDSGYDVIFCRNLPLTLDSRRADMHRILQKYSSFNRHRRADMTSYSAEIFLFRNRTRSGYDIILCRNFPLSLESKESGYVIFYINLALL
jgi:hypothetical protein